MGFLVYIDNKFAKVDVLVNSHNGAPRLQDVAHESYYTMVHERKPLEGWTQGSSRVEVRVESIRPRLYLPIITEL